MLKLGGMLMKNMAKGVALCAMMLLAISVSADATQRLVLFENQTNTA